MLYIYHVMHFEGTCLVVIYHQKSFFYIEISCENSLNYKSKNLHRHKLASPVVGAGFRASGMK